MPCSSPSERSRRRRIARRSRCDRIWSTKMFDPQAPRLLDGDFTTSIFTRIGVDRYSIGDSVLGPVFVGWTARGVSAVRLAGSAGGEATFTRWYQERIGRRVVRALEADSVARAAQAKLCDLAADDVPLDLETATPFERAVLANVTQIPAGYARPCALLARELDEPCACLLYTSPSPRDGLLSRM